MNWVSLKDVVDNDQKINKKCNEFVVNTGQNVNYLSDSKPNLSDMEYKTLEKLNRDSNEIRTQSYNTTIFSLSLYQLFEQWSQNMIHFLRDVIEMVYTKNISVENCYLLINTDNRMFFIGMSMIFFSFLVYLSEINY